MITLFVVDHRGVSNAQLSNEDPELASQFSNKSIAEQNSVHVAWSILMEDKYKNLRQLMFSTESDLLHFRQILVNMVLGKNSNRVSIHSGSTLLYPSCLKHSQIPFLTSTSPSLATDIFDQELVSDAFSATNSKILLRQFV